MSYPRILTIQDISCVGQCSLTVALPLLAACGTEACILPSAVLSTHTGGFKGFTFRDLTNDIPAIRKHWESENINFQAIYTGYLGSKKQIGYIHDFFDSEILKDAVKIVDPAMGDGGKLYYGFDDAYAAEMARLCNGVDVILPNITEACFMTGIPYREHYDKHFLDEIISGLFKLGPKNILLTGITYDENTTGVITASTTQSHYYRHKKISRSYHGTGDIYSSVFTGAFLTGHSFEDAARIAADFTVKCIEKTIGDDNHWYGVKFEKVIPELIDLLKGSSMGE